MNIIFKILFKLSNELDTRYVDPEFQDENICLTPPSCSRAIKPGEGICFSEFSYQNPSSLHSAGSRLSGSSRYEEIAVFKRSLSNM
jgi:hypothetical protein